MTIIRRLSLALAAVLAFASAPVALVAPVVPVAIVMTVVAPIAVTVTASPAAAQRPAWCHHDCIAVCRALYIGRDVDTCVRNRRCVARFGDNVCAAPATVQFYIDRACATLVPLPRGCMRRYDVRTPNDRQR